MSTPATDLADFLRARYAERRAVAEAATKGPWTVEPVVYGSREDGHGEPSDFEIHADGHTVVDHQRYEGGGIDLRANADFIAANDPDYVLADIDLKLQLVEEHSGTADYVYTDDSTRACQTCGDETQQHPCNVLRLLSRQFTAHPDYQEGWTPWAPPRT